MANISNLPLDLALVRKTGEAQALELLVAIESVLAPLMKTLGVLNYGLEADKPTADGRPKIFIETDTGKVYYDTSVWTQFLQAVDYLTFDTDPATTPSTAGTLRWNAQAHCLEYIGTLGNVVQIGLETWGLGVNKSGGTVVDGAAVYMSGVVGGSYKPEFDLADARNGAKCSHIGVVTRDIANNEEGPVTVFGLVNDVDTSSWAEGDLLYVAADATGVLTSTPPDAPNFRVCVATVLRSHPTEGILFVDPRLNYANGVTLKQLDVVGAFELHEDARTWDDVYPSSVTVGVGSTAPAFTAYNGGSLKAYEFTGGVSNKELQIGYQIYHSYEEGSLVTPHIHLTFTSGAADVGSTIIFDLEYEWQNVGDTGSYSTTTLRGTYTITSNSTVYRNVILSFGDLAGTGKKISSTFMTRLVRRQDLDTFTGSCWLLSSDIHIHKNTIGSSQPTVK